MFVALVLMYFLLACFACWLLLFPGGRAIVLHTLVNLGWRMQRRAQGLQRGGGAQWQRVQRHTGSGMARACLLLWRHRWLSLAGSVLVIVPPLLAWLSSDRIALRGYADQQHVINDQVSDLLKGEQLVPPPTLPPLLFSTAEVTQLRPLLGGASRNWQLLDHDYAQRLLLVFKIMKDVHGYDMVLLEGYRSPARQDQLAAAGPNVTNARAFQSYHQYGLAADCAFMHEGKLIISEKNAWAMRGYRLYGVTAESVGLRWGGRWTMMDFGHTELPQPRVLGK
jgi:peptidoglycan L-alanyl-D-glutamate endopeptidase CwlK